MIATRSRQVETITKESDATMLSPYRWKVEQKYMMDPSFKGKNSRRCEDYFISGIFSTWHRMLQGLEKGWPSYDEEYL